ncbi:MAG: hypothetical protein JW725_05015 [Candidatus Babeliaceae bacterium]|nr:hypothetical protein [Candidatus Babeliaceae bacterium]
MTNNYATPALFSQPSELAWENELRQVLSGQRDHLLFHAGSADAYVDSLIVQSAEPSASVTFMHSALANIARTWRPGVEEPYAYTQRMLELISAFTPKHAFEKIMSVFDQQNEFGDPEHKDYDQHTIPLTLLAIQALSAYYPAAPSHAPEDSAFQAYVQLMSRFLHHPVYAPIASIHLLEINSLSFKDKADRMSQTLSIIAPAIVSWVFEAPDFMLRRDCLPDLFSTLLITGQGMNEFEDALISAGNNLELKEDRAFIITPSGKQIILADEIEQPSYFGFRLDRLFRESLKFLKSKGILAWGT